MSPQISRRDFLKGAAASGAGLLILTNSKTAFGYSANEKLNVACIGVGGKGHSDMESVAATENIVALCDVDAKRAEAAFTAFPNVPKYTDFRKMLDKMHKQIDAVVVSTPDHTHAAAAVMAMRMGMHCYCQKPLTYSIYEARLMRDTARKYNVATQMGNQGTASSSMRESVEIIRSGAIGDVYEIHVWSNRPIWPQGCTRPEPQIVPNGLDWDCWLGPAPKRPYNEAYLPFKWRGWKDYGTGAIGDMGCHTLNMPFMALNLTNPISVVAEVFDATDESYPKQEIIRWTFGKRGDLAPCKLTWYDGGLKPKDANILMGRELPGSGCVLIGTKGRLFAADDYGGSHIMMPEEKFADYKLPAPTLPRSPGHYVEWINAAKGGDKAMSNFDYASGLTETALLGNLAALVGEPIYWDPDRMRAINCPKADKFINPERRKGWDL